MSRKDDRILDLSSEQLLEEAEKIKKELENDPSLNDVHVTKEMDEKMMAKIHSIEREKMLSSLSEEDKEALLLGRKLQDQKKQKRKMPKKKKTLLLLAATLVLVLAFGITGMGGKNPFTTMFGKMFGDGDKTYVETDDIDSMVNLSEEEAYAKVKKEFGEDIVWMIYKPYGMEFDRIIMEKENQKVSFYYLFLEKMFHYQVKFNYVDNSLGWGIEDQLVEEYKIVLPEAEVTIHQYLVEDTKEEMYAAQFTYKNAQYFLTGVMEREEFEKILKNLHFF